MPGRGPEVRPAVLAVAHPGAGPAVDEDAVDLVALHDLPVDRGHELEVVRPQGAGHPHLGRGPVSTRLPGGVDGDPVGVRRADVVVGGVRVGPREHDHAELPAAFDQLAERVAVAQEAAAVVERDLRGVVGDAAAGAEARSVAMGAAEVVEPERQVEPARVVLDQRQLSPAHRAVDPARGGCGRDGLPRCGLADGDRGPRHAGGPQERSARDLVLHAGKTPRDPERRLAGVARSGIPMRHRDVPIASRHDNLPTRLTR